ncbi:hypothetical protein ALC53_04765 [Atta colombica]|uniref:Uncharacterized protein n=1 Tax=Atta colombica TaxID=520822 RepID=A0A195BK05_9HYME|nr:hypothetical protein ALC53_04765 [Atta colombica]
MNRKMDEQADSARSCEKPAYRKRRRSYSAAISEENSLDEDDNDEKPEEEESYPHRDDATRARCCRQRECIARKISSVESETRTSTESFVSKRASTRESSGDIAKSWSEIELPELLLTHPEILSRMMRCRCFLAQFSACQYQCRCIQCQYQRRKISSTSSCFARDSVQGVGARRKDSGNSVSTCQSFLPPSSGRNSVGSLYVDIGDKGTTTIQRRHSIAAGPIPHRRYSDQTHSLYGCKIGRIDNRRLSVQPLVGDAIGCEGTRGAAEPIIASNICPRTFSKATVHMTQSVIPFHPENSTPIDIKDSKNNKSRTANKSNSDVHFAANKKSTSALTGRKNSALPITPKMMRRRFSEQLILEGGLGSVGESENLFDQLENVEEAEESFTAINARKKITLNKHYYPEGGWGYVIIIITILVHLISHGLQLASGLLMNPAMTRFEQTVENSGTAYRRTLLTCLTIELTLTYLLVFYCLF